MSAVLPDFGPWARGLSERARAERFRTWGTGAYFICGPRAAKACFAAARDARLAPSAWAAVATPPLLRRRLLTSMAHLGRMWRGVGV